MSYLGKEYILDSQDGFAELMDSLGDKASPELKAAVVAHKGTLKLVKNGDEYTIISSQPVTNKLKEISFKSGVEFEDDIGGNKAKTVTTVVGDKLNTVMKFEGGASFEIVREFSDSQVLVSMKTSTGYSAKRVYKVK